MARRGYSTQTRMEKYINIQQIPTIAAGGIFIHDWQLEGGDEECQIKRIVLSSSANGNHSVEWGLFQEPNPVSADFTGKTSICAFTARAQGMVDRTTTIRVPRGWTLGAKITNLEPSAAYAAAICTNLHYKVLS